MVPVQQGQMMVAPKNPAVSLLASFFLPGLGSMINGEVGKGVGILIGYLVSFVLLFVFIGIIGIFVFLDLGKWSTATKVRNAGTPSTAF